jgi:ATP/ADP translocase
MVLMLPLGILYFTCAAIGLSLSVGLASAPLAWLFGAPLSYTIDDQSFVPSALATPLLTVIGVVLLFATLHFVRGVGKMHAQFAKHLLVRSA